MNKAQLVELMAKKTGLSKRSVSQAMEVFIEAVKGELSRNRKVTMTGFGTFLLSHRRARTGVNPQTGKIIKIPEMKVPRFKPGKDLKMMIK